MARNDHKILKDPLLYGILLDTMTAAQVDELCAALDIDTKDLDAAAGRTRNALEFVEYQSRMPNWFAEANLLLGEAGAMTFTSTYTGRVVEVRPYWSLGRTELVQSFAGKPVDWPLWVGDKEISFANGKAAGSEEILQAIAEQAGLSPEFAKEYSIRLARERDTMLVGGVDGFFSKRMREVLNALLAKITKLARSGDQVIHDSLNALAAWVFPPELAFAMRRSGSRDAEPAEADPVAVINIEKLDDDRVRVTLGWLDLHEKTIERVMVQVGDAAPTEATNVVWPDENRVEFSCGGIYENADASGSWADETKSLHLVFQN